jgi:hypothetical protein
MKKITLYSLTIALTLASVTALAQNGFTRQQNVPVQIGANTLKLPWAGGLNFPLFSEFDFNYDGLVDLFIFERVNNRIIPLINLGTPNQVNYAFTPQYTRMFPQGKYWVFTHDYNCDGKNDYFTLSDTFTGIKVFRHDSISPSSFQFSLTAPVLLSQYPSVVTNIPAAYGLFPAFSDMDNDGDMDILALSAAVPGLIEYNQNKAADLGYSCDSLKFEYVTSCWGDIRLPLASNCAQTGMHCRTGWTSADQPKTLVNYDAFKIEYYDQSDAARHDDTMSCICIIDIENDNDKDLLIGGLGDTNMQMTRNGGTIVSALIDSVDCSWPTYDTPVLSNSFPCAAHIDVDNDGKKDVIMGPTTQENFVGTQFYKDTSASSAPLFNHRYNAFLQSDMIEVGEGSYPAFYDYDGDGLLDMIIGNYNYFQPAGGYKSGLSLYRNTGTNTSPAFQLITRDFAGLFSATLCTGFANDVHPTFGDIDGDGDKDMLLGDFCGNLQLYLNSGSNNLSSFGTSGIPSTANYQGIDIGSNAAPQFIDLDRDGKLDLVIGRRNGYLRYYRNNGTTTNAVFNTLTKDTLGNVDVSVLTAGYACPFVYDDSGSYRLLVGNEDGYVFRFGNIDGNLNGAFSIIDTIIKREEGGRTCPGMGDIDGDGLPDLLVGNYAGGVSLFYQDNLTAHNPIEIEAGPGMEVFPNPSSEQTVIQFSNLHPGRNNMLNMFDVTGQLVFSYQCNATSVTLDVSALSAGVYLLRLEDGKFSVTRKLVVY